MEGCVGNFIQNNICTRHVDAFGRNKRILKHARKKRERERERERAKGWGGGDMCVQARTLTELSVFDY